MTTTDLTQEKQNRFTSLINTIWPAQLLLTVEDIVQYLNTIPDDSVVSVKDPYDRTIFTEAANYKYADLIQRTEEGITLFRNQKVSFSVRIGTFNIDVDQCCLLTGAHTQTCFTFHWDDEDPQRFLSLLTLRADVLRMQQALRKAQFEQKGYVSDDSITAGLIAQAIEYGKQYPLDDNVRKGFELLRAEYQDRVSQEAYDKSFHETEAIGHSLEGWLYDLIAYRALSPDKAYLFTTHSLDRGVQVVMQEVFPKLEGLGLRVGTEA